MLAEKRKTWGLAGAFSDIWTCERLGIAAIATDTRLKIVHFNEKARSITGYDGMSSSGMNLLDLFVAGDLKKRLMQTLKQNTPTHGFSAKGSILTRSGRIRKMDCRVTNLYYNEAPSGLLITLIDVSEADIGRNVARIVARAIDLETMCESFMGLLDDPMNLKLARILVYTDGQGPRTFTRVFPHGGVRKKPHYALDDSQSTRKPDKRDFKLCPGDRSIGALELVAYGGSRFSGEDLHAIQSACDVLSSGIARFIPPVALQPDISPLINKQSETSTADTGEHRISDIPIPEDSGLDIHDIISSIPHGTAICDRRGHVIVTNDAMSSILDLDKKSIEGEHLGDLIRSIRVPHTAKKPYCRKLDVIAGTLKTGRPETGMIILAYIDASRRTLMVNVMPLCENGVNIGCVVTIRDVTVPGTLIKIGRLSSESMNRDDFIEESLDEIINAMRLKLVLYYQWDGNVLVLKVQKGDITGAPVPECRDVPDSENPSFMSRAFLCGKPLLFQDYRRSASVRRYDPIARARQIRSAAAIPLQIGGKPGGVLIAATGIENRLGKKQLSEMIAMCDQLSTGLRKRTWNNE